MNKYIFNGNLGKDAEVRALDGGKVVCNFSVAVQDGYGDNQRTKWVKCALFGKRAEGKLPQYLTSGTRVLVTGNPQAEAWMDGSTGNAKGMLSVFVDDIELLSASQQGGTQQPQQNQNQGGYQQQAPQQNQGFQQQQQQQPQQNGSFSEDIPF